MTNSLCPPLFGNESFVYAMIYQRSVAIYSSFKNHARKTRDRYSVENSVKSRLPKAYTWYFQVLVIVSLAFTHVYILTRSSANRCRQTPSKLRLYFNTSIVFCDFLLVARDNHPRYRRACRFHTVLSTRKLHSDHGIG